MDCKVSRSPFSAISTSASLEDDGEEIFKFRRAFNTSYENTETRRVRGDAASHGGGG